MSATDDSPREQPAAGSGGGEGGDMTPWLEMQASPEFKALRNRWRRFIFTMSALFLAWFLLYVLLGAFAQDLVNTRIGPNITLGLLLGLLQFVSTFAIAIAYMKFADKNIDPDAEALKTALEEKL